MKYLNLSLLILITHISLGQVSDDFSDGEFTSSPIWFGETSDFEIASEQLKLNAIAAGESYLVTTSSAINSTTWEIKVALDFSPSSQNRAYVYLVADEADLERDIEGYYVLIGNTDDEISLYRQDSQTSTTEIIDGTDDTVISAPTVSIRVTRDALGNWELLRDLSGGTIFTSEGIAFDNTYTSSSYFGVLCDYSAGNIEGFLFDDISVVEAEAAFGLSVIVMDSQNSLRVTFNQDVDQATAETVDNYTLGNGFGTPISAIRDGSNLDEVVLSFSENFVNNTYFLNLNNIDNFDLDETLSSTDIEVAISVVTDFRNITINEIYADFNPSAIGLPDTEFIELYNNHSLAINLGGFAINGAAIDDFSLAAGAYVILTDDSDVDEFTSFGDVATVSSFPNLTNGGMQLVLTDNLGNVVDSLSYTTDWYQDSSKDDGGFTLEQINPEIICSYDGNWIASGHADGGTPGVVNSVFDDSPDAVGPNLASVTIIDEGTVLVTFDEPMDATSLQNGTYEIAPSISVTSIAEGYQSAILTLSTNLTDGTLYTITTVGLTDCAGNAIVINSQSVAYGTVIPFKINEIIADSENSIRITFSKDVDQATAETVDNYTLGNGFGTPISAIRDGSNLDEVVLLFSENFVNNTYSLNLNGIDNFDQNESVSNIDVEVVVSVATDFRDVTINEIYADFNPSAVGLPDTEFIELYNNHSLAINLGGFAINGAAIDDFSLAAGAYVILTDDGDVAEFTSFGDVATVSSFPNLTNGGMQLILTDNLDNVVDSLSYTTGWYQDSGKDDGGFTLEQINPEIICSYDGNWIASSHADGGTPGVVNSVFDDSPDTVGPNLVSVTIIDESTVLVAFDEPMDATSLQNGTYEIAPSISVVSIVEDYQSATLALSTNLTDGTLYTITTSELTDCVGNAIVINSQSVAYGTVIPFEINEIIADSENSIRITFNENVDELSAETAMSYTLSEGFGNPVSARLDDVNPDEVILSFNKNFTNNTYTLSVDNISNFDLDETLSNIDVEVTISVTTGFRDITINEIYADFNPSAIGLPDTEFIELYNNHSLAINLGGFAINGAAIDTFTLAAGAYVILTDDGDVAEFTNFGDVVAVPSFPSLANGGMQLILTDNLGNVVDSLSYTTDWYQDSDKDDGGFTLEQINPEIICSYDGNWIASSHADGGTPGVVNNSFDNTADIVGPNLISLTIVDATTMLATFDEPMDATSLQNGNYVLDPSITVISIEDGYQSVTLTLDTDLIDGTRYGVTMTGLTDCAGNTIVTNSQSVDYGTVIPFAVSETVLDSENSLRMTFNENVNVSSAETLSNYTLSNGFGSPASVAVDVSKNDQIVLTFDDNFANNIYTLNLNNIDNFDMNETISDTTVSVDVRLATDYRNITINEIYADFNPSAVGLPDTEFIELFNNHSLAINLGDFEINGAAIDTFTLAAGAYVILTDDGDVAEFTNFGDVVAVPSFPSLANGGMQLTLTDNLGNVVDSLSYTTDWYQDSDKDDGGFTLEQINPEIVCSYDGNWIASSHADGGTPGVVNSVFDDSPDTTGPNLVSVSIIDENTILVAFDEPMGAASLQSGTYEITPSISVVSIVEGYQSVTLGLESSLVSGTMYTITMMDLTDCTGNIIIDNTVSLIYDTEPPVLEYITIPSENQLRIIWDEELKESIAENETNYNIDNGIGNPSAAAWNDEYLNEVLLSFDTGFQEGNDYVLSITSLEDTLGNVLSEPLVIEFSYDLAIDSLFVISSSHLQLLFLEVPDELSATLIDNYSVDKDVGYPITAFLESGNDRLVNLVFQQEFDENKTLTLTVEQIKGAENQTLITPQQTFVYDTSSPKVDTIFTISDREISIVFSEKVEKQSAEKLYHYEYEDTYPIHASLGSDSKTVTIEFKEPFESEVSYELLIDEVQDLYENAISTRIKEIFVYDVLPPSLDSLYIKSPNEIVLLFNEALGVAAAENVDNYRYSTEGINPIIALLDLEDSKKITLIFDADLIEDQIQVLSVNGLSDQKNNEITESIDETIDNLSFYLGEVYPLNKNQIQLTFNKLLNTSNSNDLSNYSLSEGLSVTELAINERSVTLTVDQDLADDTSYTLLLTNILDHDNMDLSKTDYEFLFDSKLISAQFINSKTITLDFEVEIDGTNFLNTDFVLSEEINPVTVAVNTSEPETIKLVFANDLVENQSHILAWNLLTNVYGNTIPGYIAALEVDTEAPSVLDIGVVSANELSVKFSELLNKSDATFGSYYHVDQGVSFPDDLEYNELDSKVYLSFEDVFLSDTEYQITIVGVNDLSGNQIDTTSLSFIYQAPYQPKYGELIITEIMSNPNDQQVEFFELYNRSTDAIELTGLIFKDGNGETVFTEGVIEPDSYMVISADNGEFLDVSVGELRAWLTLNNGGESLSIYAGESLVFSTTYSDDWYQTDENKGFSLEMVDTENYCGESTNWSQSMAEEGSPGFVNTIATANPDSFGPSIEASFAESANVVLVQLSEKIKHLDNIIDNIMINPRVIIDYAQLNEPDNTRVEIGLFDNLLVGNDYVLTISGVEDCAGNSVLNDDKTSLIQLLDIGDSLDIIINEVLFNPRSGGVDFVEIYNNSSKIIDLKDWQLASVKSDGSETYKNIATDHLILQPQNYMILTGDVELLSADYPISNTETFVEISSFPSYNDDEGTVQISNDAGQIIDSFTYEDDYHFSLIDDVEGVSLERVSFIAPTNDPNSWQSAASTASYATPGLENSQFILEQQVRGTVNIDPKVFFPNSSGSEDFTTINYQLDKSGSFANIFVFSTEGRLIRELAKNQLLSTTGFVVWDGTDQSGSLARVGYYIVTFEIYDALGNKSTFKETVVLGAKF